MKNIGQQAKEFRLHKEWKPAQMAKAVGTSRQNIESLEEKGDRQPRYIKELAKVMGVTVDDLLNGRYSPGVQLPKPRPTAPTQSHPGESDGAFYGRMIGKLFDKLPDDVDLRTRLYSQVTALLQNARNAPEPTPEPLPAVPAKTQPAKPR